MNYWYFKQTKIAVPGALVGLIKMMRRTVQWGFRGQPTILPTCQPTTVPIQELFRCDNAAGTAVGKSPPIQILTPTRDKKNCFEIDKYASIFHIY